MFKKSLLIMLLLALFAPWAAMGQNTVYTKVTKMSDITSTGKYILVNEANGRVALTTCANSSNNYIESDEVTISDGIIATLPENTAIITISNNNSSYSLSCEKNETTNYLYVTYSSNSIRFNWRTSNQNDWSISFVDNNVVISRKPSSTTYYVTYQTNYNSNKRFTAATSAINGSIALYMETVATNYPAPKNLSYDEPVGGHEATLRWESPSENLTGYAYQYKKSNDEEWGNLVTVGASVLECTIENLDPETSYDFRVKALYENDPEINFATISFTTDVACPTPTNLSVTYPNETTATLNWSGTASSFNLQYKAVGDADFTTVPEITKPYDLTVSTSTSYTYKVQAICGGGDGSSNYSDEFSFTTPCFEDLPYEYNFDEDATNSFPACWTRVFDGVGNTYPYVAASNAHSASNSLYFYHNPSIDNEIAVLPGMKASLDGKQIVFWAKSGSGTNNMEIGYMTNPNDVTTYQNVSTVSVTTTYQEFTVDFGNYSSDPRFIAIKSGITTSYVAVYVDDITVQTTPTCTKPLGLSYDNVTARTVDLTWTPGNNETNFDVSYSTTANAPDNGTIVENVSLTSGIYQLTGLTPETHYYVSVRANCTGEAPSAWCNTQVNFTTDISCPVPTDLTATLTEGNGTIVTLTWTKGAEEEAWELQYATNEDFTEGLQTVNSGFTTEGTTVTCNLTGLTAETKYYARVKASCGENDESVWSSVINFKPTNALTIVVNNSNAHNSNEFVPIYGYYTDDKSLAQYIIPASDLSSIKYSNITQLTFHSNTPAASTWSGGTFEVYLKEVSDTYLTSNSFDWTGTKVYTGKLSVSDNKMCVELDNAFEYHDMSLLVGIKGTQGTTSYTRIYWNSITTTENTSIYGKGTSATGTYKKLVPMTTISYIPGETPSCVRPQDLTAGNETAHTADLTWTKQGEETSWDIAYSTTSGTPESANITVYNDENPEHPQVTINGSNISYTITGLDAEETYYIYVRANCSATEHSDWSEPTTAETTIACPAPTSLAANTITPVGATITWTSDADNFQIQIATYNSSSYTWSEYEAVEGTINANTYTFDNLTASTQYRVQVKAICGGIDGESQWSSYVQFTTDVECPAPKNLAVGTITTNSAVLNWDKGYQETTWNIDYKLSTASTWTSAAEATSTRPFTLENLESGKTYNVRVQAICTENSEYAQATFTTAYGIPFAEAFSSSIPTGWTRYSGLIGGTITTASEGWSYKTLTSLWSGYHMYLNIYSASWGSDPTRAYWLATPNIVLGNNNCDLTFDMAYTKNGNANAAQTTGTDDKFVVLVSTDNAATWTVLRQWDNAGSEFVLNNIATTGEKVTLNLGSYTNQSVMIAFYGESTVANADNDIHIDNVEIDRHQDCEKPVLALNSYTNNSATFSITNFNDGTTYTLHYREAGTTPWIVKADDIDEATYTLTGLDASTEYEVEVLASCNENWSNTVSVMTRCDATTVDAAHPFFEGFEAGSNFPPQCWDRVISGTYKWSYASSSSYVRTGSYSAYSGYYGPIELVMPVMTITGTSAQLCFWSYNMYYSSYGTNGKNSVKISVDGDAFTQIWTPATADVTGSWKKATIDLTSYIGHEIILSFCYEGINAHAWYVDDITVTADTKVFYNDESNNNWSTAANWTPSGAPTASESALITANVTIPNGTTATANNITINNGTLTIADGGQLKHNNAGVIAKVQKGITGYGEGDGKWYFIGTGLADEIVYNDIPATGLVSGDFDLYAWNHTQEEEWRNYRQGGVYSLYPHYGYLYANEANTTINFTGTLLASNEPVIINLDNNTEYEFGNWSLYANPFMCEAAITTSNNDYVAYYRMNEAGDGYAASTANINPLEGIFVKASADSQSIIFSRASQQTGNNPSQLQVSVSATTRSASVVDNAIVRFDEGNTLEKFCFRENSTKLYIPQDGKDYAVVNAGKVGEMPVNFKAEKNGSYTLSFTSQEVSFSYLHLIDNLTGSDVDLLANPSYTFNAKTSDYESRFRLVFATGSTVDGDTFSFVNGSGNLCIFGIEGKATVQVIDILGHVLSSETFSGSYERKLNVAPGVYMIRLINGNDVKVQKIVVR